MSAQKTSSSVRRREVNYADKGLMLATCNADGKLYIYDLKSLQNVKQSAQVQISSDPLSCLTWNKNTFDTDMIMIGSKGNISNKVKKVASFMIAYTESLGDEAGKFSMGTEVRDDIQPTRSLRYRLRHFLVRFERQEFPLRGQLRSRRRVRLEVQD